MTKPSDVAVPDLPSVGRYRLLFPIGRGGMAGVYLARAEGPAGFEREVAVKLVRPEEFGDDAAAAVFDEARLAARIRHANVVPVLDMGEDAAGVYLVMEYIEGDSLAGLTRSSRPPLPIALRILVDALGGLAAAHDSGGSDGTSLNVIHRDFSPQNILVGIDGASRLSDFGIARARSRPTVTQTGDFKGKIGYVSPEHARGMPIDQRSDVWSAGVVGWELCAGQRLYDGDQVATLMRLVSEDPPRVRAVRETISPTLDQVIAAALVRDPGRRIGSARLFRERLLAAGERIATTEEVAAYVQRSAGRMLEVRRGRIEDLERSRASRSPVFTSLTGQPNTTIKDDTRTVTEVRPAGLVGPSRRAIAVALAGAALFTMATTAALRSSTSKRGRMVDAPVSTPTLARTSPEPNASVAEPPDTKRDVAPKASSSHAGVTTSPRPRHPARAGIAARPSASAPAVPGLSLVPSPYETTP